MGGRLNLDGGMLYLDGGRVPPTILVLGFYLPKEGTIAQWPPSRSTLLILILKCLLSTF